jgi:hypothetical protein
VAAYPVTRTVPTAMAKEICWWFCEIAFFCWVRSRPAGKGGVEKVKRLLQMMQDRTRITKGFNKFLSQLRRQAAMAEEDEAGVASV